MEVQRTGIQIKPNNARVLFRPFEPTSDERFLKIIARVMSLTDDQAERLLTEVLREFGDRHHEIQRFFLNRFEQVRGHLLTDQPLSLFRRLLIGSYFTQEYSLESAALFNPSMVWHPDQSDLPEGARRFILSLRATGEGHISSIVFRSGVVSQSCRIRLDEPGRYVTSPDQVPNPQFDKTLFARKLYELGVRGVYCDHVLAGLGDPFTLADLEAAIARIAHQDRAKHQDNDPTAKTITTLARSNYEICYAPEQALSERVIFPTGPTELNGVEDARFVRFVREDGSARYYATYTAYDGRVTLPQLLETEDFLRFTVSTLNGPEVRNKGFALFPRAVRGHYAMISRQDNENIYLMYSDNLNFWYTKELIAKPTYPWEYVQLGNCGSPIETDEGWLVLTHGVGPMRKYAMGAMLLDLDDPSRVIGRLAEPLLTPDESERSGYVPNVVYSCGALVHNDTLVIPYAMSDYASTFATVAVRQVLDAMVRT
ncbi:MAG: glycoside hydrolase family 130 protein [Isosphaeraceae bacterium]